MTDNGQATKPRRLALVASKGSLDMVYPVLILASTAGALGWEVGVFCTFYGLDLLNRKKIRNLKVAPIGNPAMPPPFEGLPVQVPNILGVLPGATALATTFMKSWMENANMPSVEELLDTCLELGVNFYACATTMGVMGVKDEDLIEGVSCLGATGFLDFAANADISMFI